MRFVHFHPQIEPPHAPPPQGIRGPADGHAPQPEEGMLRVLDLAHVPVQFQKDVLGDFFGQPSVAGHSEGERKHHGLMLVHESFEIRLPIVGHGFRFYFLIRGETRGGMQRLRAGKEKVHATTRRRRGPDVATTSRRLALQGFRGCRPQARCVPFRRFRTNQECCERRCEWGRPCMRSAWLRAQGCQGRTYG